MPIEQYAYLYVEGSDEGPDWSPEELTAALEVEPTEVLRKREMDSSRRRPARRTTWQLGTERTDEVDTDVLVRSVLDRVADCADRLRAFVAARGLSAGLEVVITMKAEKTFAGKGDEDAWGVPTPASYLSPETIRTLAALGIGADFDMYVWTPEDMMNDGDP